MGKKKEDERQKAYDLYCNTQLTQKEIAAMVGVSAQRLTAWVSEGEWKQQRDAQEVSVGRLIQGYYLQLSNIHKEIKDNHNGIPTSSHTDMQIKITNAINALKRKFNLSTYHAVLKETLEWMRRNNLENAKAFGPAMLEFLTAKAKQINDDKEG